MRTFLLIFLAIMLSGCASMNNQFDCPHTAGVMCKSLDEVNAMIDDGSLSSPSKMKPVKTLAFARPAYANTRQPLRQQEQVMRLWVAPYEDNAGNYHQETTIFKVVKPGIWVNRPMNAYK